MEREIRRVNAGWEHPKRSHVTYLALQSGSYKDARERYEKALIEEPEYAYCGASDEYMPELTDPDNAWYQMYENASEGTPVTPPFKTKAELVEHLCTEGTFWDPTPWARKRAEEFVEDE